MFRQEEVFPGGWPDKTVEAMRKRRFEQSIRQMEPLDTNRLETLPPGALARRLEQSWQEVKRRTRRSWKRRAPCRSDCGRTSG